MDEPSVLAVQPLPSRGGPSIQLISFLGELRRMGFLVHVLAEEVDEMIPEYAAVAASVHMLPELPTFPRTTNPIRLAGHVAQLWSTSSRIAAIARAVRATLIYTFNDIFLAAPVAARRMEIPSVVHLINMTTLDPVWLGAIWSRVLDRLADRIVCCQDLIASRLHEHGVPANKLRVIYNSVDTGGVRASALAESAPALDPGTLKVGMVASMDPRKGHLNLIAAAARVVVEIPQARFFLIGPTDGNDAYLETIQHAISTHHLDGRSHLVGPVRNVAAWIRALDVFCIPSRTEGLSVAGIEAMALGRPIVATDVGGNRVAVEDGVNGLICAADDPRDLARKIVMLLRDAPRRQTMGAAGRERAEERFTVKRNGRALAAVLTEVAR
jgi:glycosyltransferase involved in cell wall biosynthesis